MKKKIVGIVTITNGPDNYGNVLQNYALQCMVKQCGYLPETINNLSYVEHRLLDLYIIPKVLIWPHKSKRTWNFIRFRHKYIKYSPFVISRWTKRYARLDKRYCAYLCGSDQVWNPYFSINNNRQLMLLKFSKSSKKIGCCASFGVKNIESKFVEEYRNALSDFCGLFVREKSGADLIYRLTGKRADVFLDPTMLVETKIWLSMIAHCKIKISKKYILIYVLGNQNSIISDYIENNNEIAQYEVVNLNDINDPCYGSGPSEFLWLLKNAELVLTDSFHATAFSILFGTEFGVVRRLGEDADTFNRIETLLTMFNLEQHILGDDNINFCSKIDKNAIHDKLSLERVRIMKFLMDILST